MSEPHGIKLSEITIESFASAMDDLPAVSIRLPGCAELRMHAIEATKLGMRIIAHSFAAGTGFEGETHLSGDLTRDLASVAAALELIADQRREAGI